MTQAEPGTTGSMWVEVAYAKPDQQVILKVNVPDDATAQTAIEASGILERFPEIDLKKQKIGIFSRLVALNQRLQPRDRVEIYRPLLADPKAARRERAAKEEA
ncbi:RnfH family protein [Halothiobacillus sp.]|jgi:putative ubiquitin-RnfH superfamily antitoxin RatB of RatAB toxin-antitoxin module|uniref:RnfH family protein n=1 Tax=Halothiobacillus sp. TaxID=1891311 RepID=UPI00262311F0|nr:RnfH family protein [Halothiobacillus sp.]MDD3576556.1 RnfH family protein [Halothiobacillus sp.]MDD4967189.1 RnfH family protein [Halothiobacillus sp.]